MDYSDLRAPCCINLLKNCAICAPRAIGGAIPAKWSVSIVQHRERHFEVPQHSNQKNQCVFAAGPHHNRLRGRRKFIWIVAHQPLEGGEFGVALNQNWVLAEKHLG